MSTTVPRLPDSTPQAPPTAPPTTAPAATEQQTDAGRDYVILKKIPGDSPAAPAKYEQVAVVEATSNDQAVRRAAELPGTSFLNTEGPTTLVAIPSRSFSPVTVEVQVTRRVVVS